MECVYEVFNSDINSDLHQHIEYIIHFSAD